MTRGVREVVAVEDADERLLERKADRAKVRRVLQFGNDPDRAMQLALELRPQVDDLLEGEDAVAPVPQRVALADVWQALRGAQRLELGEGEVLREPPGHRDAVDRLGRPALHELRMLGDVRGLAQLRVMTDDEDVVLR